MEIHLADDRLMIAKRSQVVYLSVSEIIYIERICQKTLIHTEDKCIHINLPLKDIQLFLPQNFVRSHKSFIVNIQNLKELKYFNRNTFEAYYENRKTALVNKRVLREFINRHSA